MRRLIACLIIAALLAGSVVAYAELSAPGDGVLAFKANGASKRHLAIRGQVRDLYPGATRRMPVRVRNLRMLPVILRRVRVIVRSAGNGCSGRTLRTRGFRGRQLLPHGKTTYVGVDIGMSAAAPDACRGARYPLRFRATARPLKPR
jgi:hypothetical protein